MKTIWKFVIPFGDGPHSVSMPEGARIVFVGPEPSSPSDPKLIRVWAEVQDNRASLLAPMLEEVIRHFIVRGTGHPVPQSAQYVGSVVIQPYCWHIFEV